MIVNPIKIVLVDDHAFFRNGVKALLSKKEEFLVVGEAENGKDALSMIDKTSPEIVLMDIDMPVMNGLVATKIIHRNHPEIKVIILTVSDYETQLFEAIKNGASGYLLKNMEPEQLIDILKNARNGEAAINGILASKILDEFSHHLQKDDVNDEEDQLTDREIDVLNFLVRGLDNQEIAESLSVSINTVKTHLSRIMEKLHLHNRVEAVVYAITEGLVEYPQTIKDKKQQD